MNFKEWLLNERYSGSNKTRGIYYHGTGSKYLNDILNQGLIVAPKEKSWDSDNDTSFYQSDRSSYGGIYVTLNLMKAYVSAGRTAKKTNSDRLLIILNLQSRSLIADEDSILVPTIDNMYYSLQLYKVGKYGSEYDDYKNFYNTQRDAWVNTFLKLNFKDQTNDYLLNVVKKLASEEGFMAALTRAVSFETDAYEWRKNWQGSDNIPSLPTRQDGENLRKNFVVKMTRLAKPTINSDSDDDIDFRNNSARIMSSLGYKGSNKIICILSVFNDYSIKLHYGTVPQDFVNQFKGSFTADILYR